MKYIRNFLLSGFLLLSLYGNSQITANILTPPSGMVDKQQLWNIIVINTGTTPVTLTIQLSFVDAVTNEPVMGASTASFTVPVGSKQYSADLLSPIQYNVLSSAYNIDAGPTGLLPIGTFTGCYNFLDGELASPVLQECMLMNIPPLSPPLLASPDDGSKIDEYHPLFIWLPPSPTDFFTGLQYDFRLVELYPNQSPADAIQQNVPVLFQHAVLASNLQYPLSASPLDSTKQYAWQITANNNLNEIGKSEVWMFSFNSSDSATSQFASDTMYIKLEKESEGYGVFFNKLRLDYFNETTDSTWQILVQDASLPSSPSFVLALDTTKMNNGENLLEYDATEDRRFINHHIYLLQIPNSRGELWRLRFEYIKND